MSNKLILLLIFMALLSYIILGTDLVSPDTLVTSVQVGDTPTILEYYPNSGKVDIFTRDSNILNQTVAPWGCAPEITKGCRDMTNASSTYLGIVMGAVIGALISWLVYVLQKGLLPNKMKTSRDAKSWMKDMIIS